MTMDPDLAELQRVHGEVEATESKPSNAPDERTAQQARSVSAHTTSNDASSAAVGVDRTESEVNREPDANEPPTDNMNVDVGGDPGVNPDDNVTEHAPVPAESLTFENSEYDDTNVAESGDLDDVSDPDFTPGVPAAAELVEQLSLDSRANASSPMPSTSAQTIPAEHATNAADETEEIDEDESVETDMGNSIGRVSSACSIQSIVSNRDERSELKCPELVKAFGLPDPGKLIEDENYVLCYNRDRRVPYWVARLLKRDHLKGYAAHSLAFDNDGKKLYWSDLQKDELHVIDLETNIDWVVARKRIDGMAADGKYVYFKLPNDSTNADGGERAISAFCPVIVSAPVSGSSESGSKSCLLVGTFDGISLVCVGDSTWTQVIAKPNAEVLALTYDSENDIIFYCVRKNEQKKGEIRRFTKKDGNDEIVVSEIITYSLAVDNKNRNLYWTNPNSKKIMIMSYCGTKPTKPEVLNVRVQNPGSIVVVPECSKIFWTEGSAKKGDAKKRAKRDVFPTGNVESADLDGRNQETFNRGIPNRHWKSVVNFHEDEDIPVPYRQKNAHYEKADELYNLNMGHIVHASDCIWNKDVLYRTFNLSQVFPQDKDLNNGLWNVLEDKCAHLAHKCGSVMIVAVTIFLPQPDDPSKSSSPYWLKNRVLVDSSAGEVASVHGPHVPTHIAMIFLVQRSSGKLDDEAPGETIAVGAYQFPNSKPVHKELSFYKVSVEEIEKNTGLTFFGKIERYILHNLKPADELPEWNEK